MGLGCSQTHGWIGFEGWTWLCGNAVCIVEGLRVGVQEMTWGVVNVCALCAKALGACGYGGV